jgi:hypothetical protein
MEALRVKSEHARKYLAGLVAATTLVTAAIFGMLHKWGKVTGSKKRYSIQSKPSNQTHYLLARLG